ncbi:hypothetical protein OGATHE_002900 [Ogataea polymorpha]|uniref:Uncharacterized protein n=1 Tax=Ogataea polymorpha TaxID=460523 RepID=A0A9P8PDX6_9ASCO|nr:hypothetical protein OGATHE_002900 [Ogataea polymorpha]
MLGQTVDGEVPLDGVLLPQANQPVNVALLAPSAKQTGHQSLRETRSSLNADLVQPDKPLEQRLLSNNPAESASWSEDLGERVQSDNSSLDVHRREGFHKRGKELLVSDGRWLVSVLLVIVHLQEVVWLVLDDNKVMLASNFVNGFSSFVGKRRSSRVLTGTDSVQQLRLWLGRVPF